MGLSDVRPPRRPLADRLGLRLYMFDRLRFRLAQASDGPELSVFANVLTADLEADLDRAAQAAASQGEVAAMIRDFVWN